MKYSSYLIIIYTIVSIISLSRPAFSSEEQDLLLVKKLFNDKFYDTALKECENFLRRYPAGKNLDEAHIILGQCYYQKDSFQQAIYEFNSVLDKAQATHKDEALYWLGEAYFKANDFKNSLNCFQQLIEQYPYSQEIAFAYY